MKRGRLLAALLLVSLVAAPFVLGEAEQVRGLLLDRFVAPSFPAAPIVHLLSPIRGDGVSGSVRLVGNALAVAPGAVVTDVQWRLDGREWASVPGAPRGLLASPFAFDIPVDAGDHVVEVRATDGAGFSLVARSPVRAATPAPPTLRILTPADGAGVPEGGVLVQGTVAGTGPFSVFVRADASPEVAADVQGAGPAATWSVTLPFVGGVHRVTARGVGSSAGLPQSITVSVGSNPVPPTLVVLSPADGSSFGASGSADCDSPCVKFSGVATGDATGVLVAVDGRTPHFINDSAGAQLQGTGAGLAWSWPFSTIGLVTGEHSLRFTALGPGDRSAPRDVRILVHTGRSLSIVGDDAPRLTLSPLSFRLVGAGGDDVAWTLDGAPLATLSSVTLRLATPGDHLLEANVSSGGTARLPLYALDRLPLVRVTATPGASSVPTLFDANASDVDGTVVRYSWDFGDGATLETLDAHAEHAYARPGVYSTTVAAVDDFGFASVPASVAVSVANHPPVPNFAFAPSEPNLFDNVTFADISMDPDGRVVASAWDFGESDATAVGPRAHHRFAQRGDHPVTLLVQDDTGATSTLTRIVRVRNIPPTVAFSFQPATPQTGEDVTFTDASVKLDGRITQWVWDFGDGVTDIDGTVTHAFQRPGRFPVTLTVKDDWGERVAKRVDVLVTDAHPDVRGITADPPAPRAFDAVKFQAIAFDREGPITSLAWDFGDGSASNATMPLHRFAHSGAYNVSATARDAAGLSGSLNITLLVGDQPPTITFGSIDGGYAGLPTTVHANASDLDGRIVAYAFDMDGDGTPECLGTVPTCTFTFPHDGTFSMWVNATDDEGATATAFRLVDIFLPPSGVAPPGLHVDSPAPGALMRGSFLVRGTAAGTTPVRLVEVQMRSGPYSLGSSAGAWIPATGTNAWSLLLDTRAFPDGDLQLVVRATDESGSATQVQLPVTVDNERSGVPAIDLRVTSLKPNASLTNDTTVRGIAYSQAGITSIRWRLDDGAWRAARGNELSWAVPLTIRGLTPGAHELTIEAWHGVTDHASTTLPFIVAGELPILLIDVPPGPVAYSVLHAEGRATPGARVLWRLDNEVWREAVGSASWSLNVPSTAWTDGAHTVTFKAVNEDLALQSAPVTFPLRVLNVDLRDSTTVLAHVTAPKETPLPGALVLAALALVAFGAPRRRL